MQDELTRNGNEAVQLPTMKPEVKQGAEKVENLKAEKEEE